MATGKNGNPTLYYENNPIGNVESVNITDFTSCVANWEVCHGIGEQASVIEFVGNYDDSLFDGLIATRAEPISVHLQIGPWYMAKLGEVHNFRYDGASATMDSDSWKWAYNQWNARFLRWLYPKTHFVRMAWWDIRHAVSLGRERDG